MTLLTKDIIAPPAAVGAPPTANQSLKCVNQVKSLQSSCGKCCQL